uniref:Uncharacterized protein n=1 Tax=Molossus molossus TaxID=27622 RepID=A0A7J8DQ79_MOLMO|nr:hypothetical protein HJG59_009227 [Molossus molossus]
MCPLGPQGHKAERETPWGTPSPGRRHIQVPWIIVKSHISVEDKWRRPKISLFFFTGREKESSNSSEKKISLVAKNITQTSTLPEMEVAVDGICSVSAAGFLMSRRLTAIQSRKTESRHGQDRAH